jgi:dipeptidyl aminopeptidase/acylaminoacyl peptidase
MSSPPRAPRRIFLFLLAALLASVAAAIVHPRQSLALAPAQEQPLPNAILSINEDCTAFSFAPDGRIIYSVRRMVNRRQYQMQRDDIWIAAADGKRRRIVDGEKLIQGAAPFSYTVRSLRWSPDGTRLTAELATSVVTNEQGDTRDTTATLLLEDSGKEIRIAGADSIIPNGENASWLDDEVTVVYLLEAVKPRLLFAVGSVRPVAGRGGQLFENALFSAAAWDPRHHLAVAVERDAKFLDPPKLVLLDLIKQTKRDLVKIEGFAGGLTLSPSGDKLAYFRDAENLEVREISKPDQSAKVHVPFGTYQWSRDERRILIKRGPERRSDSLAWVSLADSKTTPILHELTFRDFAISPDGKSLAVMIPGKRNIVVYPLE